MDSMRCVPRVCRPPAWGNGVEVGDLRWQLRVLVEQTVYENTNEDLLCPEGMEFCIDTHQCVMRHCSANIDKAGDCPVIEEDELSTCLVSEECFSDSEGCEAQDKCCPTACGGTVCQSPEYNLDLDSGSSSYRMTAYIADMDPEPIRMVGNAAALFSPEEELPNTFEFDLSTASTGCTWKKVSGETVVELEDGEEETVKEWTEITDGEVLDSDVSISCIPDEITWHGFAKINVTDNNDVVHTFGVVVLPAAVPPTIAAIDEANNITLQEDRPKTGQVPVTVSVAMSLEIAILEDEDIAGIMSSENGKEIYESYRDRVDKLKESSSPQNMGIIIKVVSEITDKVGEFFLMQTANDGGEWEQVTMKEGGRGTVRYRFKPERDYSGTFDIDVFGWTGAFPIRNKDISLQSVRLAVIIENTNDSPYVEPRGMAAFDFNPRSMLREALVPIEDDENTGVLVSEIVSEYFVDPEDTPLGMCVSLAESYDVGGYQYKPDGGSWTDMNITIEGVNDPQPFKPRAVSQFYDVDNIREVLAGLRADGDINNKNRNLTSSQCLLLASTTLVRFKPSNAGEFWGWDEKTRFGYFAWDEAADEDNSEGDMLDVHYEFCANCAEDGYILSYAYLAGYAMRMGCNGEAASFPLIDDICGVCGGDNSTCVDCSGEKDGEANWNQCGNCVGGNTGEDADEGLDCRGMCSDGEFERFESLDDACLPSNTDADAIISKVFCDGVWKSGAKTDDCGECTGGTTGLEPNNLKDQCGVCEGDGQECLDCIGDVDGSKRMDVCGECLEPTDPTFNTGCSSLGQVNPASSSAGVQTAVFIRGAGLETFSSDDVTCVLSSGGSSVDMLEVAFNPRISAVRGLVPDTITAGTYAVTCTFTLEGDSSTQDKTADGGFQVYGLPTVTSLSPDSASVGSIPSEVTVTGTGFVDTGDLWCFTDCPIRVSRHCRGVDSISPLEAVFVSATEVTCIIPEDANDQIKIGATLKVAVALMDPLWLLPAELDQYDTDDFTLTAPAPQITGASFIGACAVRIEFDDTISDVSECSDCLDTASVNKLGTDPECGVRGSSLFIRLGDSSSLVAEDELTLKADAISQRGAVANVQYASGSIAVATTTEKSVKFESIKAPPEIGNCENVTLRAKFQGAGCSSLTYHWAVEYDGDTANLASEVTDDIDDIQSRLNAIDGGIVELTSDDIEGENSYQFFVWVETHLGELSENKTVTILRKADDQALMVDLGNDYEDWDPTRDIILRARVQKSECVNFELSGIEYIWEAPGQTDFSMSDFTSVGARIRGGSMKGGKTYTIQLIATVSDNAQYTTTSTLTITTASQPLEPRIARFPYLMVGAEQDVVLDASDSTDPDQANDVTYYNWACEKLIENDDGSTEATPCMLPENGTSVQFEDMDLVSDNTQEVVTIPGGSLESNSVYQFALLMSKGTRSAQKSLLVYVKQGTPPTIIIEPFEGQHDPNKPLVLKAAVTSPLAFEAVWSSVSGEGLEVLTYDEIEQGKNFYSVDSPKRGYPVPLLVIADLTPGATYEFQLDVSHADSESRASVTVTVNAPPSCTALAASPTTGTAIETIFELEVQGCDDEETDFPLSYMFFIENVDTGDIRKLTASPLVGNSEYSTKLESGNFSFGVSVCDQQGSCSLIVATDDIEAAEPVLDDIDMDALLRTIEQESATDGESGTATAAATFLITSESASDEQKEAGIEIAKEQANNQLGKANPESDPEGSAESLTSAEKSIILTKSVEVGGVQTNISAETKAQFVEKATGTVEAFTGTSGGAGDAGGAQRRRRKRAADDGSDEITAMDMDTAEGLMSVLATALEDTPEDDITAEEGSSYFSSLEASWQGVCAGLANGQEAQVGKTSILTFRAYTTEFDGISDDSLFTSCAGCAEVDNIATFMLGNHTEAIYSEWNCTDTDTCYGGCLATGQLNLDLLTPTSDSIEPLISTRLSDIVAIHLINPTTYGFTELENITEPITFSLNLTSVPDTDTFLYMCRSWDKETNDWTESYCNEAVISHENGTDFYTATCECFTTGYFGVFEGGEKAELEALLLTTTDAFNLFETTTLETVFNISEEDIKSLVVKFSINADFNTVVTNETVVKAEVKTWLAGIMNVEEDRIVDLMLTAGSIVVEFQLMPGATAAETNMNGAVARLKTSVEAASSITIGGTAYPIDATSFEHTVVDNTVTTTTGATVTESPNGMGLGVIIGVVVGCSLVIILVVVVVAVVVIKKKSGANKVEHSPRTSQAELGDYRFQAQSANPDDEALYGKAPEPVQAKPTSASGARQPSASGAGRTMTPVS